MPAVLPSGLDAFVDHVVPILRTRGLLRTAYDDTGSEGTELEGAGGTGRPRQTLRERYGLPRPANQYVTPAPGSPALARV